MTTLILAGLLFTPKELRTFEQVCKNKGGVVKVIGQNYTVICVDGTRVRLRKRIA